MLPPGPMYISARLDELAEAACPAASLDTADQEDMFVIAVFIVVV